MSLNNYLSSADIADFRTSIQLAEQERRGGIANRVSPMISMSALSTFLPLSTLHYLSLSLSSGLKQ